MFLFNALMAHMALYSLLNVLLSFPPLYLSAVVLLNSKETQAELGWTSYPPNGVSLLTCIFSYCLYVCLFACSLARLRSTASCSTAAPDLFIPPLLPVHALYTFFFPPPTYHSLSFSHLAFVSLPVQSSSLSLIDGPIPG